MAITRPTFIAKGKNFTEFGVMQRCVRDDLFSQNLTLHYVNDGTCSLRLLLYKQEYIIPLSIILKALVDLPDSAVYKKIMGACPEHTRSAIGERVEAILLQRKSMNMTSSEQCQAFIGT